MLISDWLELFNLSHYSNEGSIIRIEWPDGKSTLEQSQILIQIFKIIEGEYQLYFEQERKKK